MKSSTVRIDEKSQAILAEIIAQENETKTKIIRKALESYRRERFLRRCSLAYASLKSDEQAWKEEIAERELWDNAISDGVDEDK